MVSGREGVAAVIDAAFSCVSEFDIAMFSLNRSSWFQWRDVAGVLSCGTEVVRAMSD